MSGSEFTVHHVLAGAYAGKDLRQRVLLAHASIDGGDTAICGRVKDGNLCDFIVDVEVNCAACIRKIKKMGLIRRKRN